MDVGLLHDVWLAAVPRDGACAVCSPRSIYTDAQPSPHIDALIMSARRLHLLHRFVMVASAAAAEEVAWQCSSRLTQGRHAGYGHRIDKAALRLISSLSQRQALHDHLNLWSIKPSSTTSLSTTGPSPAWCSPCSPTTSASPSIRSAYRAQRLSERANVRESDQTHLG